MRRFAVCAAGVLLAAGLAACTGSSSSKSPDPAAVAAEKFLTAYGRGDIATAAGLTTDPTAATAAITASVTGLGVPAGAAGSFTTSNVTHKGNVATVGYAAEWKLPGTSATWKYKGSLPMAGPGTAPAPSSSGFPPASPSVSTKSSAWAVTWAITDLHPSLTAGRYLEVARVQPPRADLLDSAGQPIFTLQPVVVVGINTGEVTDLPNLASTLAFVLNISPDDIIKDVQAAKPNQFVPVITLRRPAYDAVRDRIRDLPGTQFQEQNAYLAPTARWAQPLLGQVGAATKELIDGSSGAIAAGDTTGLSGLQRAYNSTLAGTAGLSIQTVAADGSDPQKVAEIVVPAPGKTVSLTLDRTVQTAAEAALANVSLPAAIVALQPSTGKILAVANSTGATENIAMSGQYPPGSSFKIATYAAAFGNDPALTPDTQKPCPGTIVVNGQTVRNEDNFDLGTVSLTNAFAFSCNTTAANLNLALPADALGKAAQSLGFGAKWSLPVDAFSGSMNGATTPNEQAAQGYGQGTVLASPLAMAEVAGAAATGTPRAPSLEVGKQGAAGAALPAQTVTYLNALMRAVVTTPGATGRDLASLPGNVEGKTGTAEFGTDVPPKAHSWFVGTRGDLAFAVFIYGGEASTTGAVPVAKQFLTAVP